MGFFAIFQLISGFITSGFKAFMTFITTYPKLAIGILVLALSLYGGFKVKHAFEELQTENIALVQKAEYLEKEKVQLKADRDLAISVNKANQEVIEKISVAAEDSKQQVVELQQKQSKTKIQIVKILDTIHSSTPEENGPVAPVLKNAIQAIQSNREASE